MKKVIVTASMTVSLGCIPLAFAFVLFIAGYTKEVMSMLNINIKKIVWIGAALLWSQTDRISSREQLRKLDLLLTRSKR